MKKSGKDRLKCVVYESTRAPLTRSPFPKGGKAKRRRLPQRMEKEWEEAFPPFVILPCKTSGIHSVCVSRSDRRSRQSKRGCEEMRIHFFTAPSFLRGIACMEFMGYDFCGWLASPLKRTLLQTQRTGQRNVFFLKKRFLLDLSLRKRIHFV